MSFRQVSNDDRVSAQENSVRFEALHYQSAPKAQLASCTLYLFSCEFTQCDDSFISCYVMRQPGARSCHISNIAKTKASTINVRCRINRPDNEGGRCGDSNQVATRKNSCRLVLRSIISSAFVALMPPRWHMGTRFSRHFQYGTGPVAPIIPAMPGVRNCLAQSHSLKSASHFSRQVDSTLDSVKASRLTTCYARVSLGELSRHQSAHPRTSRSPWTI